MHWKTVFFIAVSISVILRVSCESEEEQSVDEPMEDQTGSQAREPEVDDRIAIAISERVDDIYSAATAVNPWATFVMLHVKL